MSNFYSKILFGWLVLLIAVLAPISIILLDETGPVTTTVRDLMPTSSVTRGGATTTTTFGWDLTTTPTDMKPMMTSVGSVETENNITITYVSHHSRTIENVTIGSVFMDDIYIKGQSVKSVLENLYNIKFGIGIGMIVA